MTLPWDDPIDQQQDDPKDQGHGSSRLAAGNNDTLAFEPMFVGTQQQAPPPALLPDTQVNDAQMHTPAGPMLGSRPPQADGLSTAAMPTEAPVDHPSATVSKVRQAPLAEPTQLVGAPTQLAFPLAPSPAGEPTQLSGPSSPSAARPAGTALAVAAAQAMTGAHPTQASVLPSAAGFPAAMPSLAPPQQPAATAAGAQACATAAAQQGGVPTHSSDMLPISRPQADAVLHLPSQPSGSQHAAHPHGPPRPPPPDPPMSEPPTGVKPPVQGHSPAAPSAGAQRHPQQQESTAAGDGHQYEIANELGAAGGTPAHGAGQGTTLLDSILGHDDDDSIWMPPASMPDSAGGSQGAPCERGQPAALPVEAIQDQALQAVPPSPGTPFLHLLYLYHPRHNKVSGSSRVCSAPPTSRNLGTALGESQA